MEEIKQIATDAVNAGDPTRVTFGTVISASPLKIKVDQKITLTKEFLVLTRNVTDFTTKASLKWETEDKTVEHFHTTEEGDTSTEDIEHKHDIIIEKKDITIHNALKVGEEVILIQVQGGQKYIVLDRVG